MVKFARAKIFREASETPVGFPELPQRKPPIPYSLNNYDLKCCCPGFVLFEANLPRE
jgi:hypothetical protein